MARTIAKDHDKKRAQILKSAARVFAREGFDRASMTQLARECGISKANIYHYYDSKDAILFDILEIYLRELRDLICGIQIEGLNAEERLHKVIAEILLAYQGVDDEHRVQTSGMSALPEEQQKVLRGYQRDMVEFLNGIIAEIAPDVFGHDADKLRAATMSVFGMLNWYYMWNAGAGPDAREDYAAVVSKLTLHGVRGL
ncbi:TetR/AcrR family transcriptional regulator [Phaeobacter gallaeciensis]|uniref:TetR/AcrR family transcriptional regulator n=2 Tax=Roseobacteraceae TaxID=2854170 RepID=A0A366WKZ9_9RHOB|nr:MULTISPECIES: TetR/AcrR family transcriptional regulator [Roseobacteraceae]MBT3141633.1 TetR/AcrR family transcriptional regulator [Falsiruegeria litorea]MBT8170190.1 TetR/AcrR family transcriptional regulator [Falsiruegeria litorea]RBW50808.1 TetR/AcrR family transcriptional regulator [Phaeobacter gallaeciensis]